MKYPQRVNTLVYKRQNKSTLIIKNYATDNVYEMGIDAVRFMNKLDGKTNPFEINSYWSEQEVKNFLRFLKRQELVRTSRVERNGLLLFRMTLFKIKATPKIRLVSWFLNLGLMLFFFPLLAIGLFSYYHHIDYLLDNYNYAALLIGSIVGLVAGLCIHEFGHAVSGLAFNAKVSETGLMIGVFGFGAYVLLDEEFIKNKLKRVQIMAAGIEMNLALFGASAIMFGLSETTSSFFWGIAMPNLLLALTNVLFITGLDGSRIINILIGSDLFSSTFDFIFDRRARKKVLSQGLTGYAKIATCALGIVFQLSYPLLIIVNILSIAGVFV